MMIFLAISVESYVLQASFHVLPSVGSSVTTTKGIVKINEIIFITPYTLAASIFFDGSDCKAFVAELPNFPLSAAAAFARDAYRNASTLISTPFPSLIQANPTPPKGR
jgi:hypothetical protein